MGKGRTRYCLGVAGRHGISGNADQVGTQGQNEQWVDSGEAGKAEGQNQSEKGHRKSTELVSENPNVLLTLSECLG